MDEDVNLDAVREDKNLRSILLGCFAYTAFADGCVVSSIYSDNEYITYALGALAAVSIIPMAIGLVRDGRLRSERWLF